MRNPIGYLSIVLLAVLAIACSDNKQNNIADKFKAVMVVHDELMAYMGPMSKAKRTFTHWADSLGKSKQPPTATITVLRNSADTLAYADRIMHTWMQGFDADYDKKPADQAAKYLDEQLAAANTLKTNMLAAIAYANQTAAAHQVPAQVVVGATQQDHSGHNH